MSEFFKVVRFGFRNDPITPIIGLVLVVGGLLLMGLVVAGS